MINPNQASATRNPIDPAVQYGPLAGKMAMKKNNPMETELIQKQLRASHLRPNFERHSYAPLRAATKPTSKATTAISPGSKTWPVAGRGQNQNPGKDSLKQDAKDLRELWCGVAELYAEVLSVFGIIVFIFHFPVFLVQSFRTKRRVLKKYSLPLGVALVFPPMLAAGFVLILLFIIIHPWETVKTVGLDGLNFLKDILL